MHLIKEIVTAGIYDWLAHKGTLMLGEQAAAFGRIVDESLHYIMEGRGAISPVLAPKAEIDGRIREGFTYSDVEEIRGILVGYFSQLAHKEPDKALDGFINGVVGRVKTDGVLRGMLISSAAVESLLIEEMKSGKKNHQVRAMTMLGERRSDAALPYVRELLWSDDMEVRIIAVNALGCFKGPESIPDILKALKDPDVHMRWGAVNALMNIRSQDTVEALIDTVLHDEDETVRTRAVYALTVMGSPKVADLLTTCSLNEPTDVCRERAKAALYNIQFPGKKEK